MYDPYAEFNKTILSNGLEVHSLYWDRPWIGVEVVVHAGGREDPVEMPGLAHFVEHAVSQNVPGRQFDGIREFFEICGGTVNFGATDYLSTRYKFRIPANSETFRESLSIFGSMLLQSMIEREIERERKVILQEFNSRYPFLDKLEWDMNVYQMVFKGHRLETYNRPLGRPEGFLRATETDLQGFYDKYYVPENMSMVVIGGFQADEVIAELERSPFGANKSGARNQIPNPLGLMPAPDEKSRTVRLSDYASFKIDQIDYRATWSFPAGFPRQARRIFDQVLEKILFDEIRERRGLAYSIRTGYTNFRDVYEYVVTGRLSPEATSYIDDLVQECISTVPSRVDLFERKLKSCMQRCLMTDLSGRDLAHNSAEDLAQFHRIIPMQEENNLLQKVRFEQMAEAAAYLGPDLKYTFITCP